MDPFGTVMAPATPGIGTGTSAIGGLIQLVFNLLIAGGGVYALINFILAGYAFLSAGDDPKKVEGAWAKIWQSVLGLVFIAGAFVLAGIFGKLIFDDFDALLKPVVQSPIYKNYA